MAIFTCHSCKKELQAPVAHVLEKMIFAHMVAHEVVNMTPKETPLEIFAGFRGRLVNETSHELHLILLPNENSENLIVQCDCKACSERPFRSVPSDARLPTGGPAPKNQEGEGMTNG